MLLRGRLSIEREATLIRRPHPKPSLPNYQNRTFCIVPFTQVTNQASEPLIHQNTFRSYLFHQLRNPPHLSEARGLHALLLVHGFFHPTNSDTLFGSQLVKIYVNFGCLQEALLVFGKLPRKSNIAWNAILRGFVDMGQFEEAIEFYHLMLNQGIIPDNFTYPLVLKACSSLSALEEGRRVKETILFNERHNDLKINVYVVCAMIDMFAKCGSLKEAQQLFEEMPSKDLACWTAMICGTVWNGEWLEALYLFRRMRLEGLNPDSVIVAAVLPVCGRLETKKFGTMLQSCAVRSGFDDNLYLCNALIDMYCKCGDTFDANRIFCSIICKDTVSWSTLIAGYAQNCLYQESFELFLKMREEGVETNAVVAASVFPAIAKLKLLRQGKEMHNYVLKQGLLSDMIVGTALIDVYAHCGSIREAEVIFESISDADIMVWNSLITGYNLKDELDSAFQIFRRVWETRLRPNSITLVSILPLCTKMGTLALGKEIHGYATKTGLREMVSVANSLIDMYSKCGCLELGLKVFKGMRIKNTVTYNTLISAHGIHGLAEQALLFYEEMKEDSICPNKVTFVALLSACSHAGLVDKGWLLYNSMVDDYGIQPDMEHYSCMVDLLARAGHLDDAYKFIKSMPVVPDANVFGSLLGACRVHNKVELAQLLEKHILDINTSDPGYYVLLSNVYASCKRWKEMAKARIIIKDKGLEKKPGSSWIEVRNCIFVFNARGLVHPESDKILETLDCLSLEMKDTEHTPIPRLLSNLDYHF